MDHGKAVLGYAASVFAAIFFAMGPSTGFADDERLLPAVDGINAKFDGLGSVGETNTFGAAGAVTIPISHRYGFQLDGVALSTDPDRLRRFESYSAGPHLFWRDPSLGMLGFYGDFTYLDIGTGKTVYSGGIEAAGYFGNVTVDGHLGLLGGDLDGDLYGTLRASFYPMDNLQTYFAYSHFVEKDALALGGEWMFESTGKLALSSHGSLAVIEGGDFAAQIGLRVYFNKTDKPLIKRHREDDPPIWAMTNGGQNIARIASAISIKYCVQGPLCNPDLCVCS